jgi:AraC family transcriptional regulator, positive regulator of tynA and feaB
MNRSWSTHAVAARAPIDIWRDAVGLADGGIETRVRQSPPLLGTFATRSLAGFKLVRFKSTGHAIARDETARHVPAGYFLVSLQMGGEARLVQGRREVVVGAGAGAVGLVDVARPFELSFPSEVERIFCFVPHAALQARAPWLAAADAASLGYDNPLARIMAEYMRVIGDPARPLDERATLVLLDGFLGALAIATALQRARTGGRDGRDLRLDALKALMRTRLANPALTPATVAAAAGISTRTLHKLFELSGTSFGAWLLAERLEACAAALSSADARIADIAFAAGFNDLSHFNRRFKARFGTTPRQWRMRGHSA